MARTALFRALRRAFRKSAFLHLHPELTRALEDFEGARAAMRGPDPMAGRREFLKSAAALGLVAVPGVTLLSHCASARARASRFSLGAVSPGETVAVLGGGLSGLTVAYRLSRAGVACVLYEAAPRLGGRILTRDRFNSEGMFCELGGELIDSSHEEMLALARELGVAVDDFRPYDQGVKGHQYHIGGKRYYDDELAEAAKPLAAHLLADMKLVYRDLHQPVITYDDFKPEAVAFDRMSLAEYLYGKKDVDKWVLDAVNIAYLGEFGLEIGEQSSINLMSLIDPEPEARFGIFGDSDEAMRIRGGNSRLIEALASAIQGKVPVHLGHRLARIADKGSSIELTFETAGGTRIAQASRAVCTVPFPVLRDVEGVAGLGLGPTKLRAIQTLSYGTNAKYMLGFSTRAWRKPGGALPATNGYTFTDLPSQAFWDTSREQKGESGILTNFLGGNAGNASTPPPTGSILRDLEAIHPGVSRHFDGNRADFLWGRYPLSRGSYACPTVGQYTTIVGAAKEHELGGRLLFAGEHVSERFQGYMNGAVQSAEDLAQALVGAPHARRAVVEAEAEV